MKTGVLGLRDDPAFRYAGTVMDVCKVNEELNRHLEDVATFTAQVSKNQKS